MKYDDILHSRFSAPAAIVSFKGGSCRVVDINDRFLSELWMNVDKESFFGSRLPDCFDADNLALYEAAARKCIETGEERTVETWRSLVSDCCGVGRICLKSRLVLLEKNEDEALVYEMVTNVTNEKRTKDTLEDIEHRYKQASEQINIYNWEYTIATKEMRPCYRCMRDLGLPAVVQNYPEPAIDMGIFPPDYADMYREMMRKVDAGAKELEADIPLTVGRIPFRVKYTTEFDKNGNPVKAFGSATLISETELGHIKIDNQIISTLAEAYHCIYMANFVDDSVKEIKSGGVLPVTDETRGSELLGMIASKLAELGEADAESFCDVQNVRSRLFRDCDRREFVYKDEANNQWVRIAFHVIERGKEMVDRLIVTASFLDDEMAQKLDADRLIAAQKRELEERQNRILEAMEEANRANRAKTVFFSNMSHDIRTPMSAITGFSRLALEEIDEREHLEDYLDKIVVAGEHLMNLINDILDMSQIESGKMELKPRPACLRELLLECADMVRGEMEKRGLEFTVTVDEMGDDVVSCDRLRFRQILLNLLSNAYKYSKEGGSVFLGGRLLERKDVLTYEVRVRDTGIGMSEEFSRYIWEAYSRERTDLVHETQGTGLGMAIVRRIVDQMQGDVELKTAPGKGSEFIITFRMEPCGHVDDKERGPSGEDAMSKRYDDKTILVVDDTKMNLKLAERVLVKFGFKVLTATGGEEAVEIVSGSAPGDIDLVLMDVMMPDVDGMEATRRIRALPDKGLADIPIIAMTANAFATDIANAMAAGMNAHVPKPFVKEDLITKIDENLPS